MSNIKPYITYIHKNSSVQTLGGFVNDSLSIAKNFQNNINELVNYNGETNKNNIDRIFKQYSDEEKEENSGKNPKDYLLKYNTKLLIPKDKANAQVAYTISDQTVNSETFKGFLGKKLVDLHKDKQYRHVGLSKLKQHGIAQDIHYHITVWIWVRQLNKWLDISQFIKTCQTSVTEQGGNFQISLPPIVAVYGKKPFKNNNEAASTESDIQVDKNSISFFQGANLHSEYVANASFFKYNNAYENSETERNQFYFHNLIQENDLVYIRYEYLETEVTKRKRYQLNVDDYNNVSDIDIPGGIYDMIGLVDTNSITFNPESSELDIQITGRDLVKPLLEDGTYFFPIEFANGGFIKADDSVSTDFVKRIFGEVKKLSVFVDKPIEYVLKFVINLLANTGFVPDEVFKMYGDERNTVYRDIDQNIENMQMRGVWQIINFVIDKNISQRRIVDSSIGAQSGSLINFIRKVCEEPFVEFFSDTYGDKYYYIVRQPPFNEKGVKSMLDGSVNDEAIQENNEIQEPEHSFVINIEEKDIIQEQLKFDNDEVYTWFKLDPQGMFFGGSESVNLAYLPAFYLPEYVNVWGAKPFEKVTNYINYQPFTTDKKKKIENNVYNAALKDLKFLVDIYSYLPFTRKGQVSINMDRRIKRGTFIRYKPTNEVFYVTGVSHSFIMGDTMNATTTLQLERGMVEDFVWGKNIYIQDEDGNYVNRQVSYFNIVNTNIKEDQLNTVDAEKILKEWSVNKLIFDFFLKKRQFAYV